MFAFFKGIDQPAQNGVSTATVNGGLPAGAYRVCSITCTSLTSPPGLALMGVPQRAPITNLSLLL